MTLMKYLKLLNEKTFIGTGAIENKLLFGENIQHAFRNNCTADNCSNNWLIQVSYKLQYQRYFLLPKLINLFSEKCKMFTMKSCIYV